jgi:two-component system, NtrC family, response regulator AlgB
MPTQQRLHCFVFDDGKSTDTLQRCLSQLGYRVTAAHLADAAMRELSRRDHSVAFITIDDDRSLKLMASMLATRADLEMVAVVAAGDTKAALEAGRRGACDCVSMPFASDQLQDILRRIEERAVRAEVKTRDDGHWPESLSPSLRAVVSLLKRAARSTAPVLLSGERGTGKRSLARLLHAHSRQDGPFVVMTCGPEAGSELTQVPHVNGKSALFRAAHGGTLLLDEVAELPLDAQAALIGWIERVGRANGGSSDVRVIALTEHELDARVAAGRFRADLHDRLRALSARVPALRERREDLLALSRDFVAACAARSGRDLPELSPAAEALLLGHDWPGNLRELESEIERALAVNRGRVLEPAAFSDRLHPRPAAPYLGGNFTLDQIEREHIERVLGQGRTFDAAAHLLGIDDSTLWRKRKRYGVSHAA